MHFVKLLFILFIGITPTVMSQGASLSRASFGEACSRGTRCDSRSSLSCVENVCQCVKPEEMMYDKNKGKCLVLSGERCSYTAVEIVVDQTQEKRWNERLDCVDNAVCNNEGYCDCSSTHFEDHEGACAPKGLHAKNCTKDDECRTDKNLMCLDGFCSCNQTEAVFDPAYNMCVARAGASCSKYERCVRNANCYNRRHGYYSNNGQQYDLCTCSPEYTKSKTGLCMAKYAMSCDVKSAPCSEEFSCTNRKCACHFPDHQTYNNKPVGECVSYVRGPCAEEIEGVNLEFPCVSNAKCMSQNGIRECLCKDGYIESEKRGCDIAHGQSCGNIPTENCDKVANLICKNGKCTCQDFQMYDPEISKCRGLVGAKCLMNATNFCVEGAACQTYRDTSLGQGVCMCLSDVPHSSRKCTSVVLIEVDDNLIEAANNGTIEVVEVVAADDPVS